MLEPAALLRLDNVSRHFSGLKALSGVTHEVVSGVAVLLASEPQRTAIARTAVTFRTLDEELLDWSLASGEWRGRAGGYAIQGAIEKYSQQNLY